MFIFSDLARHLLNFLLIKLYSKLKIVSGIFARNYCADSTVSWK